MAFFGEFRKFIQRGNVVDLAVGVIIGAAFGKLVNSMVEDLLMPPLGAMIGGVDFSSLTIRLGSGAGAAAIKYGSFLQTLFQFLVIAFCVFLMVKAMNKLAEWGDVKKEAEPPKSAEPTATEKLLAEIRDELRRRGLTT